MQIVYRYRQDYNIVAVNMWRLSSDQDADDDGDDAVVGGTHEAQEAESEVLLTMILMVNKNELPPSRVAGALVFLVRPIDNLLTMLLIRL